ncbi:MAG: nucleotidyltransferase domain-containing protein [Nanoarchaeota archaeon]|nr:nucleotidyltransferase domain-containing protein [Nanoarchaeota archaeon]
MRPDKKDSDEKNMSDMSLDLKYSDKKSIIPEGSENLQKDMDKTKKEIEKLKSFIVKKYPFTQSISILPPQSIKHFIEEEEVPKETEKFLHLLVVIPEEKFKEISKIKKAIIEQTEIVQKNLKQKMWVQIKTPVDLWEICLDSKFDLIGAISMSFPIYDKGFLGALRVAEIHKSLVLQKFDKYVVSYVIAGSFLRGDATKNSDVDVFIIINDTDVKRMPRLELKERLRAMIYQFVAEAVALAGVKNSLHIQTYLLTEFWDSVKDANPVIFTFIRDGIPIYDKGTFMPWKSLLKMGKLKPSPEAIDMFMKGAEKTKEMIERRLVDAMIDAYYGVLTPSQALIMLYGSPPPTHKETPKLMEEIFVHKEKMLRKSDVAILDKVVKEYKKYEHDTKYTISGAEIDKLIRESDNYLKRMKDLREQIEKRYQEKTIELIYKDTFEIIKAIVKAKSQQAIIDEFEKEFVKKGKFTPQDLRTLKDIVKARSEFKRGKLNSHAVNEARKNASILINNLIEYNQRCELAEKNQ